MKYYFVYIITNMQNGTLYIGVTSNLIKRIEEHKNKIFKGFSNKYNLDKLVYYETFNEIEKAILREKNLKVWKRNWKLRLIIESNPLWEDLYYNLLDNKEMVF